MHRTQPLQKGVRWLSGGSRAINQKIVGSISGRVKWRCVLGQGTSPYLPRGNAPVLTVSRSGKERLLNDWMTWGWESYKAIWLEQ